MIELRSITTSPGLGRLKRPNLNNLLNNLRDCPQGLTRRGDGELQAHDELTASYQQIKLFRVRNTSKQQHQQDNNNLTESEQQVHRKLTAS